MARRKRIDIWERERQEATTLDNGLRVLRRDHENRYLAGVWHPKALKPIGEHMYRFRVAEERDTWIEQQVAAFTKHEREKELARKQRTQGDLTLADPGTVFVNSWGYDQTQVDFYQVIERKGLTVLLRPIAAISVSQSGPQSDRVTPALGVFVDPCMKCGIHELVAHHQKGCGAFHHEYEAAPPLRKRFTFHNGEPHLRFSCGIGTRVPMNEDGTMRAYHRSWYR